MPSREQMIAEMQAMDQAKMPSREQMIAELQGSAPKETPSVSGLESGIRGAAQGLSFGFADEATAALKSLFGDKTYKQQLEKTRGAYKQAEEANPLTYKGSELAGGFLPMLVPGVGVAAGARALPAAAKMAGLGALSSAGKSEASIFENPAKVAEEAAIGGTIGGLVGGASQKLSNALGSLLTDIKTGNFANRTAFKALQPTLGKIKKMSQDAYEVGKEFIDQGIIKAGASVDDLLSSTTEKITELGGKLGGLLKEVDELTPSTLKIPKQAVVARLSELGKNLEGSFGLSSGNVSKEIAENINKISSISGDNVSFAGMNKIITDFSKKIKDFRADAGAQSVMVQIRGTLKDMLDDSLANASNVSKVPLKAITGVKKSLSKLYTGQEMLEDAATKTLAAKMMPYALGSTIGGIGGFTRGQDLGSTLTGAVTGAALSKGVSSLNQYLPGLLSSSFTSPVVTKGAKMLQPLAQQTLSKVVPSLQRTLTGGLE